MVDQTPVLVKCGVVLRPVGMECGVQLLMMGGASGTVPWCATSWDITMAVSDMQTN